MRDKFSIIQLAVIVGEDVRDAFLCNYVFTGDKVVVLQVRMDHEKPEVPSLADMVPGAIVYERELKDLSASCRSGIPTSDARPCRKTGRKGYTRCARMLQFNQDRGSYRKGGKITWRIDLPLTDRPPASVPQGTGQI